MARPRLLLVTGKLAEPALRRLLAEVPSAEFTFEIAVLPITVVALATTPWIARHLRVPVGVARIVLPGLCSGDLEALRQVTDAPVERGPADLRELPGYFGSEQSALPAYGAFDIEIVAEINHAPRLAPADLLAQALHYRDSGADVIDLGCDPGSEWTDAAVAVRALREHGMRVSIDTFNPVEAEAATRGGAELVLSVNSTNRELARSWGCEVVAIPDQPATLEGLDQTVEVLTAAGMPFRIDPIVEPIGFGFAASLGRYLEVRRRYPEAEMLMGVGNLTELTDVDSAGLNVALLGFCQELGIRSVLTTEVINWCRSSVRELDQARRLVHYACNQRVPPKRVADDLVMLRDPRLLVHGDKTLRAWAEAIHDPNFRLFAERGHLHAMNGHMYLQGDDPFELFEQMSQRTEIDAAHAFYLGYELAKATTALTLGKNYVQDQALRWGLLTVQEESHRAKMKRDGSPT
jgi:dihydropteroate synthase-like protein